MTTFTAAFQTNHSAQVGFTLVENLTRLESKQAVDAKRIAVTDIATRHAVETGSSWMVDRKSSKNSTVVTFATTSDKAAVHAASQDLIDWLQESGLWSPA